MIAVDAKGRLLIPKDIREALGIEPGSLLSLQVVDGRIVVDHHGTVRSRLLAALADVPHSMADRLAAERQ